MMNILIVGVGGQGSLLASRILGKLFIDRGMDVKLSEVHGMSQRGGSVITYIRAGERVDSPLVSAGEADMIISFEALEALRYINYLKAGGTIIYSNQHIIPMPVIIGASKYPEDIDEKIAQYNVKPLVFDALSAAVEAGSSKAANIALIGAASVTLGGSEEEWEKLILSSVPPKTADINLKAFRIGRKTAEINN